MTLARSLPAAFALPLPLGWLTFGAAFLLAFLRLPEKLLRAEFWADDGYLYTLALERGPVSIVEPPAAGYLMVAHRAVVFLETLIPPLYAPLLGNLVMLTVTAGVAAFATSDRMPWERRSGVLIALGIVLLPASLHLHGSLSHLMWPAALWMVLVSRSRMPESRMGRWAEGIGLGITGTTGIGFITAPLFLRGPRYRLVIVGTVALVQVAVALTADRLSGSVDWSLLPRVLLVRDFATPLLGPTIATALPQALVMALGAVVAAVVAFYRLAGWMVYLAVVLPVAAMMATHPTVTLVDPNVAPRYFWLVGFALLVLIVTRRAWFLAPLLILGMVVELRLEPAPSTGWAEQSACIGGPVPCEIRVEPVGTWDDVRWAP